MPNRDSRGPRLAFGWCPADPSRAYAFLFALIAGSAFGQPPASWHGAPPPAASPAPQQAPPPSVVSAAAAFPARTGESDHYQLGRAFALKFENPEYAAALATRGKFPVSHGLAEEQAVRRIRDRMVVARQAPDGTKVLAIPRGTAAPTLDGQVLPNEWRAAVRIPLEPANGRAEVLLLALGGTLYLAALAPPDTTEKGFDQFRFYFNLELSPFLRSEHAYLMGSNYLSSHRLVRLPRGNAPVVDPPVLASLAVKVDQGMLGRVRGASKVIGFRQYEMAIDMAEAGLAPGVPFPASFEIEGDPEYDAAGKFKARYIVGHAGIVPQPLWLRVTP